MGVAIATVAIPIREIWACSVCLAGAPIYDAEGTSLQGKGEVNAYFEVRGWTKKSGALDHGHEEEAAHEGEEAEHAEEGAEEGEEHGHEEAAREKNQGVRINAFLSWTPWERLTTTLNVPFNINAVTEMEDHENVTFNAKGFGDISLSASVLLWKNRKVLPSTWVEGRAFVKAPTGKSKVRTKGIRDKHVQPGTGSWDYGFGVAGTHGLDWASLYGSAFYRVNDEGSLDYEYGDVFLANAALSVPLGHAFKSATLNNFIPALQLNYRWAEKDVSRGQDYEDSGGSILYVTPSLRIQLPRHAGKRAPVLTTSLQIPLTNSWLNGYQDEGLVWSLGVQVPF